jgi:hypothetical protein
VVREPGEGAGQIARGAGEQGEFLVRREGAELIERERGFV